MTGTAHEFIHSFTGHQDTVDCTHKDKGNHDFAFENEHHHCSFLSFTFSVYNNTVTSFDFSSKVVVSPNYNPYLNSFVPYSKTHTHLRGPPLI